MTLPLCMTAAPRFPRVPLCVGVVVSLAASGVVVSLAASGQLLLLRGTQPREVSRVKAIESELHTPHLQGTVIPVQPFKSAGVPRLN